MLLFARLLHRHTQGSGDFVRRFCVFKHRHVEAAEEVFVHVFVLFSNERENREQKETFSVSVIKLSLHPRRRQHQHFKSRQSVREKKKSAIENVKKSRLMVVFVYREQLLPVHSFV